MFVHSLFMRAAAMTNLSDAATSAKAGDMHAAMMHAKSALENIMRVQGMPVPPSGLPIPGFTTNAGSGGMGGMMMGGLSSVAPGGGGGSRHGFSGISRDNMDLTTMTQMETTSSMDGRRGDDERTVNGREHGAGDAGGLLGMVKKGVTMAIRSGPQQQASADRQGMGSTGFADDARHSCEGMALPSANSKAEGSGAAGGAALGAIAAALPGAMKSIQGMMNHDRNHQNGSKQQQKGRVVNSGEDEEGSGNSSAVEGNISKGSGMMGTLMGMATKAMASANADATTGNHQEGARHNHGTNGDNEAASKPREVTGEHGGSGMLGGMDAGAVMGLLGKAVSGGGGSHAGS